MTFASQRQRAFTLIEVLVAIVILGVVALLAYRATAAMTDGSVTAHSRCHVPSGVVVRTSSAPSGALRTTSLAEPPPSYTR